MTHDLYCVAFSLRDSIAHKPLKASLRVGFTSDKLSKYVICLNATHATYNILQDSGAIILISIYVVSTHN